MTKAGLHFDRLPIMFGEPGLELFYLGPSMRMHLLAIFEEPEVGHCSHFPFSHQSLHPHPQNHEKNLINEQSNQYFKLIKPIKLINISNQHILQHKRHCTETCPCVVVDVAIDLQEDGIRILEAHLYQLGEDHFARSTCSCGNIDHHLHMPSQTC